MVMGWVGVGWVVVMGWVGVRVGLLVEGWVGEWMGWVGLMVGL